MVKTERKHLTNKKESNKIHIKIVDGTITNSNETNIKNSRNIGR